MIKHIGVTGAVLVVAITLSGAVVSRASANPPLSCYKAQDDEFGVTGNYKNAACTEKTAVLKSEYVLAEPLLFIKEDLWCAKLNPVVGPPGTGQYENATCTKKQEDGEYTEVIEPPSPPLGCYKAQDDEFGVTGNYKNAACTEKTAVLKGEYVLVEPLLFIKGVLWCAKMNPVVGPPGTGRYENATCTKKQEDGEFTEVIVPGSLPDIEVTSKGTGTSLYPLHLEVTILTIDTALEGVSGALLTGEGILLLLLTGEATSLGTFEALFLKVEESGTACHSKGDKEGEVLTGGSFHIVWTSLSPLRLGELFLPGELEITCGKVVTKVKGDVLSSLKLGSEKAEEETELTQIGGLLSGSKGKQSIKFFYNDEGKVVEAKLLSSVSGGVFKETNEVVRGEVATPALEQKKFKVTNR
jgi:hypothetical protein